MTPDGEVAGDDERHQLEPADIIDRWTDTPCLTCSLEAQGALVTSHQSPRCQGWEFCFKFVVYFCAGLRLRLRPRLRVVGRAPGMVHDQPHRHAAQQEEGDEGEEQPLKWLILLILTATISDMYLGYQYLICCSDHLGWSSEPPFTRDQGPRRFRFVYIRWLVRASPWPTLIGWLVIFVETNSSHFLIM